MPSNQSRGIPTNKAQNTTTSTKPSKYRTKATKSSTGKKSVDSDDENEMTPAKRVAKNHLRNQFEKAKKTRKLRGPEGRVQSKQSKKKPLKLGEPEGTTGNSPAIKKSGRSERSTGNSQTNKKSDKSKGVTLIKHDPSEFKKRQDNVDDSKDSKVTKKPLKLGGPEGRIRSKKPVKKPLKLGDPKGTTFDRKIKKPLIEGTTKGKKPIKLDGPKGKADTKSTGSTAKKPISNTANTQTRSQKDASNKGTSPNPQNPLVSQPQTPKTYEPGDCKYKFRGICTDKCPDGYIADDEAGTCTPNMNAKPKCANGTYAFGNACVIACPFSYVADDTTFTCVLKTDDEPKPIDNDDNNKDTSQESKRMFRGAAANTNANQESPANVTSPANGTNTEGDKEKKGRRL